MGKNQSTSKDVVRDDVDSLPSQQEKIVRRPRAKDKGQVSQNFGDLPNLGTPIPKISIFWGPSLKS